MATLGASPCRHRSWLGSGLIAALFLVACGSAGTQSNRPFDEASVRISRTASAGPGKQLARVFFVQPASDDEALSIQAQGCVDRRPSFYGVRCYGYRSLADLDVDAPDLDGNVQKTCFRVVAERTPAGARSASTATPLESRSCPSDAGASATQKETSLLPREEPSTGVLIPTVAVEVPGERQVTSRSLRVSYQWPNNILPQEILAFYDRHMPSQAAFNGYKACGDFPDKAWILNRSWAKPNGDTLVVQVIFSPLRIQVNKNSGDRPC